MSVYPKGRWWHYDFVYRGRRYYGSTGQDTRRAAEAVERAERAKAALGVVDDAGDLTIDEAAGRYLDEKDPEDERGIRTRLELMVECVGRHTLLKEIDAAKVAEAIVRRRGLGFRKKSGAPRTAPRRLAPATVNRDIIDTTLRPVLNRARKVWGARTLPSIEWKELRLKEPKGIVREYSADEIDAWRAQLDPVPRFALDLMLTYGLRFGELFFLPGDVDGKGRRLTIRNRKADDSLTLPLRAEHARLLAAMASTKQTDEPVFNMTYSKLNGAIRRAGKRAGVSGGRLIHNARHHAATKLLRSTGNLKLTQRMLGHATIQSTMRYAHASEDDLRAALDAMDYLPDQAAGDKSANAR